MACIYKVPFRYVKVGLKSWWCRKLKRGSIIIRRLLPPGGAVYGRMRLYGVCFEFKTCTGIVMISCVCPGGTLRTRPNTKSLRLSQRPGLEALVLLRCCFTAADVVVVWSVPARLLLKSRASLGSCPPPCAASNKLRVSRDLSVRS